MRNAPRTPALAGRPKNSARAVPCHHRGLETVGQLALGSILRRSVVPRIEGQTKMEREGVGGVDLLAAAGSGAGEVFNMTSGL